MTRSKACHWCHSATSSRQVHLTEVDEDSSAIVDWWLCSWACAHELVARNLRAERDPAG